VKLANNAEQSAAESAEPRTGTKGNADQQSTRQAQNWESVSQALARIRQAAKQRKKEQFTSLLHHVSVDLLRLSFFALKKDAAPGVDGLAWRDYETNLEGNLEDLHDRVHRERIGHCPVGDNTYRKPMDGSVRLRSALWKTKSSKGRSPWC
jgi:hypothetical protein